MLLTLGIVLLLLVFADFLQTTLGAQRAGQITRVVSGALWILAKGLRAIGGRLLHRYSGPVILALVAAYWIAAHWLAWILIHASDPQSVLMKETGEPAGTVQLIAYVGASLATLGASLAEPGGAWWDVASALTAVNGMVVLTLAVTFVLNITQTVSEGRTFAVLVHSAKDEGEVLSDDLIERFAGIATKFNAFPLALYFSTPARERRVVEAIADFVDRALNDNSLDRLRPSLAMLPGLDTDGSAAEVRANVARWVERYTLEKRGSGSD